MCEEALLLQIHGIYSFNTEYADGIAMEPTLSYADLLSYFLPGKWSNVFLLQSNNRSPKWYRL